MKKINYLFSAIALISTILFLNSCSSVPEPILQIPQNAKIVYIADLGNLLKKADLKNYKQYEFFDDFREEAYAENEELGQMFDDVLKNPMKLGIKLNSKIVYFYIEDDYDEKFQVWSLAISNKKKFKDLVDEYFKKTETDFELKELNGFTIYDISDKEGYIAFNKKIAYIIIPGFMSREKLDMFTNDLIDMDKNTSLLKTNKTFNEFYSDLGSNDMGIWVSSKVMKDYLKTDEIKFSMAVWSNFGKKNITLEGKIYPTDKEYQKYIEDISKNVKFNSELLKYLPQPNLIFQSFAYDPQAIDKNLENIRKQNEEAYEYLNDINNEVKNQLGVSLIRILKAFNGSFAANINDFKKITKTVSYYNFWTDTKVERQKTILKPQFTIVADVKDKSALQIIIDKLKDNISEIQARGNYYKYEDSDLGEFYFGLNDKIFFITTNEDYASELGEAKKLNNNIKSTEEGAEAKNYVAYFYLDLNPEDYPQVIQDTLDDLYEDINLDPQIVDYLVNFKFYAKEQKFSFNLQMKNVEDNTLKTILLIADKNL